MEKLGLGYETLRGGQSRPDLLRDLRLRPHRALCRPRRLRPDRAGHERAHVDHRRGAGPAAGQGRRAGHRHHRRHPRRAGRRRGLCAAARRPARASASTPRSSRPAIMQTYWQSAIAFATGVAPGPMGSAHPLNAPYQAFATADGWINVGAANQRNWERLLDVLEAPELAADPRFQTNAGAWRICRRWRSARADLQAPHHGGMARAPRAAGVPAGPVLSIAEMHRRSADARPRHGGRDRAPGGGRRPRRSACRSSCPPRPAKPAAPRRCSASIPARF